MKQNDSKEKLDMDLDISGTLWTCYYIAVSMASSSS